MKVVVTTWPHDDQETFEADDWHIDADSGILTVLRAQVPVADFAADRWNSVRLEEPGG